MLNFACIQDCSVCPFACYKQRPKRNVDTELPKVMEKLNTSSTMDIQENEIFSQTENEITETKNENLPVLADIQYSVETIEKKNLFNRRKKK